MADKEPRRRKKRRESQKKDDIRSDDHIFTPSLKPDVLDSDQEAEEEDLSHGHHGVASGFSKILFVILFSGLVVALGVVFISLQGTDEGPVDIFDADHGDHGEALHKDHSNQVMHDEHSEDALHEDHLDQASHEEHDDHDEPQDEVALEDFIESGINTLSSFFATKEEADQDAETVGDADPKEHIETTDESDTSTDQSILEEYIEEPDEIYTTEPTLEERTFSDEYTTPFSSIEDESMYAEDFTTFSPVPEDTSLPPEPYVEDEPVYEPPATPDANIFEAEEELSYYERADITNEQDFEIRDQLDEMDRTLEKSPEKILAKCEEILKIHPQSPRIHYLKAQALDKLAEIHRSNKELEDAIANYQKILFLENVPDKLYLLAGRRAADRLRFRGFTGKSVKLLTDMSKKFPVDVSLKNEVAVGYLLIGQNIMAKNVLLDVLKHAPDSGFAKVHLGFILKTQDANYEESIKYLTEGIDSREPGVIDGRFYFHLGDALHRTGKKDEALKVYEEAVKEGLFLSVYQRSLYNVNDLTGKPWWDPKSTRYAPDFKMLEKNWMMIRNEALSLIDGKYPGFMPETEGLQETGDWKQLELFARGRKIDKNCEKAPKTCALISQIPDAASCKRGQVKFSIMHPGTHVWAHTGPTNCRLRSHLGLVVPEGASIRVADEIRKWEEGKIILFDDSFEHEVWHNGSTYRLVLIVDFWHPELSAYQKRSLTPI